MTTFLNATSGAAKDLQMRVWEREAEAAMMPPGTARQSVLVEIAQLCANAGMKHGDDVRPCTSKETEALS